VLVDAANIRRAQGWLESGATWLAVLGSLKWVSASKKVLLTDFSITGVGGRRVDFFEIKFFKLALITT